MTSETRKKTRQRQKELRFGTWNVRTLAVPGAVDILAEELEKRDMDIVALQETRWPLAGKINANDFVIYYSGCDDRYYGGVGFAVRKKWAEAITTFNPVSERLCSIRVKGRFKNISLVSMYAPTEESEEDAKDLFYEALEELVDKLPKYDIKVILGDANAKLGKEDLLRQVAGKESLHDITNDNGIRILSLCESAMLKAVSTVYPRKDIHKATWVSPNGQVKNQIDHVLIDQRHKSCITDVRSIRGAECGSDHFLVLVKIKQRIAVEKGKTVNQNKYDISVLKNKEAKEDFLIKITNKFQVLEEDLEGTNINNRWNKIKETVLETTKKICGKTRKRKKKPWFDEGCRKKVEERKQLKDKWLREKSEDSKKNITKKPKKPSNF